VSNHHVQLEVVGGQSRHLPTVKALGRANAKTLGMFPAGAFDEYASRNQILGAISSGGILMGYLLYRVAKERAMITHLCVDEPWRGRGIPKVLVERLSENSKAQGLRGVGLHCRRDYETSRLWPKLGFVPLHDKPGRSHDGTELTFWWLDHKRPDLFGVAGAATSVPDDRLVVVLDANVFFDLCNDSDPESAESKALIADWLQEVVEFRLTDEIFTEINRNGDSNERDRQRALARRKHEVLTPPLDAVAEAGTSIRKLFPETLRDADESDLRQLSKTIVAGIRFFVTRDDRLCGISDDVLDLAGLTILRPAALINRLDSLRHESEYQPRRLAGSSFRIRRATSGDEDRLLSAFQASSMGENAASFRKRLRGLLASPVSARCFVAETVQGKPLALYGLSLGSPGSLEIRLFRVGRGTLAPTLARHLLARALQEAAQEKRNSTILTEPHLDRAVLSALEEDGFTCLDGVWLKLNLAVADTSQGIARKLDDLASSTAAGSSLAATLAAAMKAWQGARGVADAVALERALWPAKMIDAEIPCFIVPIQPNWAQSLFDEGLANQELFPQAPELVLKREQVYYRANQACGLIAPGRILWYVSRDANRHGTMSIRACSRLDELVVDRPKALFSRFRRLGVYEWRDVFRTAKQDLERSIMALRFSDTELFRSPVSRDQFRRLGVSSNLQSPVRIVKEQFAEIYKLGTSHP